MSTLGLEHIMLHEGFEDMSWTTLPSMNFMTLFRLKNCKWHLVSIMGPLSREMMSFFHSQMVRPLYLFFFHLLFISGTSSTDLILAGTREWNLLSALQCLSSLREIPKLFSGNSAELTKLDKDHWPGHCGWRQQNTAIKCNCTLC